MYKILRFGKRFNSKKFFDYDEARCYARRWLRKNEGAKGNPNLNSFGFSIQAF